MNDSILFKMIIFRLIGSIIMIIAAIIFIKGRDNKINPNSKIDKFFEKIILPIMFVYGAIWFSGEPVIDYIIKDYSVKVGVLNRINSPYNYFSTQEFILDGGDTYYLPKGFLKSGERGSEYRFKYAKRSKIIIDIEKVKE